MIRTYGALGYKIFLDGFDITSLVQHKQSKGQREEELLLDIVFDATEARKIVKTKKARLIEFELFVLVPTGDIKIGNSRSWDTIWLNTRGTVTIKDAIHLRHVT